MPLSRKPFGRAAVPAVLPVVVSVVVLLVGTACSGGDTAGGDGTSPATGAGASTTSASPTSLATSTATPTSATSTATAYATTAAAHKAPWTDKNADFGYVTKAKVVSGGVQFTFDRATWLFAAEVPAWNKANPSHTVFAADDYAIGNVSKKLRTFVLVTGAKTFGSIILSDQPESKKITAAQFVSRVNSAFGGVTCWIYHQYGGLTGNVVQLEEQYRP
jgi:hypothetical protein